MLTLTKLALPVAVLGAGTVLQLAAPIPTVAAPQSPVPVADDPHAVPSIATIRLQRPVFCAPVDLTAPPLR